MLKILAKRHAWALFSLLSATYFASRPSGLGQLFVMLAGFATVAALIQVIWNAFFFWKHKDASKLAHPLLIVIAFGLGLFIGQNFREWNFTHNLARYNTAASWAAKRAQDHEITALAPPPEFSDLGSMIHVHKNTRCGLMVDFFWANGFPVKHIVRRFAQNPGFTEIPDCRKDWSSGRQLAANWFELRD